MCVPVELCLGFMSLFFWGCILTFNLGCYILTLFRDIQSSGLVCTVFSAENFPLSCSIIFQGNGLRSCSPLYSMCQNRA